MLYDGVQGEVCTVCGYQNASGVITAPKSIKVLTIGNSYSCDSNAMLYSMLKSEFEEAGITPVSYWDRNTTNYSTDKSNCNLVTDVFWRNGATLDDHYNMVVNGTYYESETVTYKYRTDKRGDLHCYDNSYITFDYVLKNHDWDYIVLQQYRGDINDKEYYTKLNAIISAIKAKCPGAKVLLNMPWTSNITCTDSVTTAFGSLKAMFENNAAIAEETLHKGLVEDVIPTGTAVRNSLSFMSYSDLYRDTVHLNSNGRAIAALVWFKYFTGLAPDTATIPATGITDGVSGSVTLTPAQLEQIYSAIDVAFKNKFQSGNANVDTLTGSSAE